MLVEELIIGELYTCSVAPARQLAFLSPRGGTGEVSCGIGRRDVTLYLGIDKESLQYKFWHLGYNFCVWCDAVEWLTPKTDQDDH
jgi:hypothetical protein